MPKRKERNHLKKACCGAVFATHTEDDFDFTLDQLLDDAQPDATIATGDERNLSRLLVQFCE